KKPTDREFMLRLRCDCADNAYLCAMIMKYIVKILSILSAAVLCCGIPSAAKKTVKPEAPNDIDAKMREYGLVDIATIDASIIVEMKYAGSDNFVGCNMYGSLSKAYFRPEIARALATVQRELHSIDPHLSLIIYDAARPQSVQQRMWNVVKDTPQRRYVAKPHRGGHHNFGIAADVTIARDGVPVDMGSNFDSFSEVSHIDNEASLLRRGLLSREALNNRRLLRRLMHAQGFTTFRREWWHFQQYDINYARRTFRLLDF
ncbi:MAG: M15 family metallopeptidase, partial [Muribaculaceae bacterium]